MSTPPPEMLVVDDNGFVRKLLKAALTQAGLAGPDTVAALRRLDEELLRMAVLRVFHKPFNDMVAFVEEVRQLAG